MSLPVEIFVSAPGFLAAFGKLSSPLWLMHPGVAAISLLYKDNGAPQALLSVFSLLIWAVIAFSVANKAVAKMFSDLGGGNL